MTRSKYLPRIVVGAITMVLGTGLMFLLWPELHVSDGCLSDTIATASLVGAQLEAVYTNCDSIPKDESVRVYISAVAERGKNGKRGNGEIISDYDPGGNHKAPIIKDHGDHKIYISIGDVGSVFLQRRKWHDISIDYRIGQILYPTASQADR
ncbi:MAG TPA: hypothetical protein VGL53_17885 [Bryobacteraceae bacterium]|jgi:hypothetical protein